MAGQRCGERGGHRRRRGGGARAARLTRRLAALARGAAVVLLVPVAAACGEGGTEGLTGLPPIYGGGGGVRDSVQQARDPALVGTWSRSLVVSDTSGVVQISETRWRFDADGRVERRLVTLDLVSGFGDELVERGSWFTTGITSGTGAVTIRLEGDVGAGATFDYSVTSTAQGLRLVLGSLVYQRVEPQ